MGRNFPDWLQGYIEYTAASEAPATLHFWTGISTIAGALRRRVWIDQLHFQWTPNFYIILVAPAGIATKSTTMNTGARLLRRVKNIHFGPSSVTWQALTERFIESHELVPMGDLWEPMSCMTCHISELGTFLKPKDGELIDFITDMWDGQKIKWTRKTMQHGDVSIENPWLNVIGCTTPTWLRENFTEAMIGGGLASRCVFVYENSKRKLVAYPSQVVRSADYAAFGERLLEDLNTIAGLKGAYELQPDALTWGTEWYERHWTTRPEHMKDERYDGYLARKQTHLHKLAIILAAARRNELYISAKDLQMAEGLLKMVEPSMRKVFDSVAANDAYQKIRIIASMMGDSREIPLRDLWTRCISSMDLDVFSKGLAALKQGGYVETVSLNNEMVVRKLKPLGTEEGAKTIH